ncbi:MAG: serine hydrolase domain-containing protein [Bacteroidota bacterium]
MLQSRLLLLYPIALLFFSQCAPTNEPQATTPGTVLFESSYKAPAFLEDQRRQAILEVKNEVENLIKQQMADRHMPGAAYGLVVDNELVISGAFGKSNLEEDIDATTTTKFRIASMSKSFTAMAIVHLRDAGQLSLDDEASSYLPEMAKLRYLTSDAPPIRIKNLLTMTGGFPEDNPWGDRQLDEPEQMLMDLMSSEPSFSNVPAFGYEYSNTGYALPGSIVTQVSGMPYQQYIRKEIFEPLGMNDTYWEYDSVPDAELAIGYRWEDEQWKLEPMLHDGSFGAMGGLVTSIEDFSKYVSFHLSAWPPRNTPDEGPVRRSSLREMHTPQYPRLSANSTNHKGEPCATMRGYGYGLGVTTDCEGHVIVGHGGALPGFGSNYYFFPKYGIGLMAFGNLTYTSPWPREIVMHELILDGAKPAARWLPPSDILLERKEQVLELIQNWDESLGTEILAENFYLDKSREHHVKDWAALWQKAGAIQTVGDFEARNQLRGGFEIETKNGILDIFFTLSPEPDPKVQRIYPRFTEAEE